MKPWSGSIAAKEGEEGGRGEGVGSHAHTRKNDRREPYTLHPKPYTLRPSARMKGVNF